MTGINNNLNGNSNYYNLNKNVVGYNNQLSQANNETLNVNLLGAKGGDSLTLSSNSKRIDIKIDANETEKSLTAKIDAECGAGTAEKLKKGDGNFWRKIWNGIKAAGEFILMLLISPIILLDYLISSPKLIK